MTGADFSDVAERAADKITMPKAAQRPLFSLNVPATTSAQLLLRQLVRPTLKPGAPPTLRAVRALRPAVEEMRTPSPPTEHAYLDESASNIATALLRMTKAERTAVSNIMGRIVPGLTDVNGALVGRYATLTFTQLQAGDRTAEFAATEMSDGALRALAIVVAATQLSREQVLVIEELEANLHPDAAAVLYETLVAASRRGTVLITTHSPEFLELARDEHVLVAEYVDGVTKVGPMDESQRDLVREGLFSAAELMRSEELRREGAAPRLVTAAGK